MALASWSAAVQGIALGLSIIALGLSGFIAGYPTVLAGSYAGAEIALLLWPGWVAFAAALMTFIATISILATRERTSFSLGRSVGVLVTEIIIFILYIVAVAGFATVFSIYLVTSTATSSSSYSDYYGYSDYDYYNYYGYSGYSGYSDAIGVGLAWLNCIKADMAVLVLLFILSLVGIILAAIQVHRVRTVPRGQVQQPYITTQSMGQQQPYTAGANVVYPQVHHAHYPKA